MDNQVIESQYPITFREEDAQLLGQHIKSRHCVALIGMKRVGIGNFLRFFLNSGDIATRYLEDKQHLFIQVDLNDLIEREISPFWTLTFKRIVDAVENTQVSDELKKEIESLFSDSIQSQDLFMTLDNLRKAVAKLIDNNITPTIFFIRFDRLKDAVTGEFFDNLQGLRGGTHDKLAYVFTSFRGLTSLSPELPKASLSAFAYEMYIKPAHHNDIQTIFDTYNKRYHVKLSPELLEGFFDNVDGYVQYLQFALVSLSEGAAQRALPGGKKEIKTKSELFEHLVKDERISLQSEELWESLDEQEKEVLLKVSRGEEVTQEDRAKGKYLWDTGFISEYGETRTLFSPLFGYYLKQHEKKNVPEASGAIEDFTKKEHGLFTLLQSRLGKVFERDEIIKMVWPEAEAFGVSDWAIDRLVARVRVKLKTQKSSFEIQTIKTRGYKLVESTK